jgi:hypothetical protein
MAYITFQPKDNFNAKVYTGNGSNGHNITGVGFASDFIWIKCSETDTYEHHLMDVVRGFGSGSNDTPNLSTNSVEAEYNRDIFSSTGITSDGFELDNYGDTNAVDQDFIAWCWKAGGSGSANTNGSINSTVSVDQTAGFSIVGYTGNGTANQTVGHGLSSTPEVIIIKNRSAGNAFWSVINSRLSSTGDPNMLYLNSTSAEADDTNIMGDNLPNATTFGVDDYAGVNVNSQNFIAYCFNPVKGFSKFGAYMGDGNSTSGPIVYTGFKPAWIMIKGWAGSDNWIMMDNKRSGYNCENEYLKANSTDAQLDGSGQVDFLSNGFKIRNSFSSVNYVTGGYFYMAFAEHPVVSSNSVPATAR